MNSKVDTIRRYYKMMEWILDDSMGEIPEKVLRNLPQMKALRHKVRKLEKQLTKQELNELYAPTVA